MDDGQGGAISTSGGGRNPKLRRLLIIQGLCSDLGFSCGEKAGRLIHASGAGTLSLPDLPLVRSLGRRRMPPHVFSQDAAGGEREQPSTVDSATQRLGQSGPKRSEEHTSELQSRGHLVCRLLLEKKKKII